MKRNWLRGILLGVSVAMLLASGVALAKPPMTFTVDQYCLECCPEGTCTTWGDEGLIVPPPRRRVDLTFSNLNVGESLCQYLRFEGEQGTHQVWMILWQFTGSSCNFAYWMGCNGIPGSDTDCEGLEDAAVHESGAWDISDLFGDWDWWVWQEGDCAQVPPESADHFTLRLAQDCARQEEFVPEPGSLLLLASGLAGLGGYATLRLRSGQTSRWRTRE